MARIRLDKVNLRFRVRQQKRLFLKELLVRGLLRRKGEPPVEVHALKDIDLEVREGELVVKVRDQGIGIPTDEIPMAARRFFRASNAPRENFPGSGLGLSGARDIVERHGGSLEIESEVDRGTCVTAHLPAGETAP